MSLSSPQHIVIVHSALIKKKRKKNLLKCNTANMSTYRIYILTVGITPQGRGDLHDDMHPISTISSPLFRCEIPIEDFSKSSK